MYSYPVCLWKELKQESSVTTCCFVFNIIRWWKNKQKQREIQPGESCNFKHSTSMPPPECAPIKATEPAPVVGHILFIADTGGHKLATWLRVSRARCEQEGTADTQSAAQTKQRARGFSTVTDRSVRRTAFQAFYGVITQRWDTWRRNTLKNTVKNRSYCYAWV